MPYDNRNNMAAKSKSEQHALVDLSLDSAVNDAHWSEDLLDVKKMDEVNDLENCSPKEYKYGEHTHPPDAC